MKTNRLKKKHLFTISFLIGLSVLLAVVMQPESVPETNDPTISIEAKIGKPATEGSVFISPDVLKPDESVIINGVAIVHEQARLLEEIYRVQILPGTYWYDDISGAWGLEGGPTEGFILPGLSLGGPLLADASGGTTNVFVNGRRLPLRDLWHLQQLVGTVLPGRYWLNAQGLAGYEGGPAIVNLAQLARQSGAGGGNTFNRSWNTGTGSGSGGGTGYVMGKDWSVTYDY